MNERQSDFEGLQRFSRAGDQSAFRELVRRHIDLVFATALRKVGDAASAQEIGQNVFTVLARKAWQFAPDDSLPAWLHKTTLLESQAWLRGEMRRRRREQTAAELGTTMKSPDEATAGRALVPLLDEALLSLREKDRAALLLRYYESHSLRDVGAALGVSEDTAQKRVSSALEKLSQFFQRRGFKTATVAATAAALQSTTAPASAATLAAVTSAALQAAPPAVAGFTLLLARLATLTKAQTAAVCLALATVPVAWEWQQQRETRNALAVVNTQLVASQSEFSVIERDVERLQTRVATSDEARAATQAAAELQAARAEQFAAWKSKTRARLLTGDAAWPDDLPFVRIPKSILPELQVYHPVLPPGVIRAEARELLGLTPAEREQAEAALHQHLATMDELMESNRFETNGGQYVQIPQNSVASQVWKLPALGDAVDHSAATLQTALQVVLGEERWPIVGQQLKAFGSDTLRRALNLDAGEKGQELAVWIQEREGELVAGCGWGEAGSMHSSAGVALGLFLPGAQLPEGGTAEDYLGGRRWATALSRPALAWLREQAEARLPKKGTP